MAVIGSPATTVRLNRVLTAEPARVFAAWTTAEGLMRWPRPARWSLGLPAPTFGSVGGMKSGCGLPMASSTTSRASTEKSNRRIDWCTPGSGRTNPARRRRW